MALPATSETRFSSRQIIAVVAVVVLIIVVIAVVLMRREDSRTYGPQVVERAVTALAAAETAETEAELVIQLPPTINDGRPRAFREVSINVDGEMRRADDGRPTVAGRLKMEARGRGNVFFADGDVRLLHDAVAFRLDNLPSFLDRSGSLVEKWTYVRVPVLETRNEAEVKDAFLSLGHVVTFAGMDTVRGVRAAHFTGGLTPEQEQALAEVLDQSTSGNRALHVLARLLRGADVRELEVWVDPTTSEIVQSKVVFVRPLSADAEPTEFATLTLAFSDYGKEVTIEEPPVELTVDPVVFGTLFGQGLVDRVQGEVGSDDDDQADSEEATEDN